MVGMHCPWCVGADPGSSKAGLLVRQQTNYLLVVAVSCFPRAVNIGRKTIAVSLFLCFEQRKFYLRSHSCAISILGLFGGSLVFLKHLIQIFSDPDGQTRLGRVIK